MNLTLWTTGHTNEDNNYVPETFHALWGDKRFSRNSKELILEDLNKELIKELDNLSKG